jgi:hypothetical protein
MVLAIKTLEAVLPAVTSKTALLILIPVGMVIYAVMCWLLNVAKARHRLIRALQMLHGALAAKSGA